jgi:hypothetical protein
MMSALGEANKFIQRERNGNDFMEAAKIVAASCGQLDIARQMASQIATTRVCNIIDNGLISTKTAVPPLGLSDALAWYRQLPEGFLSSMAPNSALSTIWNAESWFKVPPRTLVPVLTLAPAGDLVSEGTSKSMSLANFTSVKLEPTKTTAQFPFTKELARSISRTSTELFNFELSRAASIKADEKMLSQLAATPGATTAASTGITAAAILSDLQGRINALTPKGANSSLWWITPVKLYWEISVLQGTGGFLMQNNKIGPVNVAPSDAATTTATLVDAKQVAVAFETATVDASDAGTAMLDDNPTSTGYQLVSMFAANMLQVKAELWFACQGLRGSAITMLTGYT